MKVGFISLGCSKNLVDSEKIMGMLQANGHTLVHSPSEAEAIIINTCGFITSAKEKRSLRSLRWRDTRNMG